MTPERRSVAGHPIPQGPSFPLSHHACQFPQNGETSTQRCGAGTSVSAAHASTLPHDGRRIRRPSAALAFQISEATRQQPPHPTANTTAAPIQACPLPNPTGSAGTR